MFLRLIVDDRRDLAWSRRVKLTIRVLGWPARGQEPFIWGNVFKYWCPSGRQQDQSIAFGSHLVQARVVESGITLA